MQTRNIDKPDEVRQFGHGHVDIVQVADSALQHAVFEPGWKWSADVGPIAGTDSCQVHHVGYVVSGRMHVVMDDGSSGDAGPGDAIDIPPGHDAWVVGNDECVLLDWGPGAASYAKPTA